MRGGVFGRSGCAVAALCLGGAFLFAAEIQGRELVDGGALAAASAVHSSNDDGDVPRFRAEVRRTAYGIPHVRAATWGGLGYGLGSAYAADNFCAAMRDIVFATSRSAEFFGETEGDVVADFVLRLVFGTKAEFRANHAPASTSAVAQLVEGFAAGMNRHLRETGLGALPEACRDASWVYAIDDVDVWMLMARLTLQASSDHPLVRQAIFDASTPVGAAPSAPAMPSIGGADWGAFESDLRRFGQALSDAEAGSNALAVGRGLSRTGRGLLLANPHRPWGGSGSFYEAHLTIPGVYDVAGATLPGMPLVGIGFNRDLAWAHTVSLATRFTLYELRLLPRNALRYQYDRSFRDLTSKTLAVAVKEADGEVRTRQRTFRLSHYGPLVDLSGVSPLLGGMVAAIRDANASRYATMVDQYLRMGQARNIAEFADALRTIGVPVFHTLAADRAGDAFYAEAAPVPRLTQAQLTLCVNTLPRFLLRWQTNNAALALDGTMARCEWGRDEDSPADADVYGYEARPKLHTVDYVANSNDSYWLANADAPLRGFPVVFGFLGFENRQQQLRTRIGHLMVAEQRRSAEGFDLGALKSLLYRHRVHAAELVLDDVLRICALTPGVAGAASPAGRAKRACNVLGAWDRRADHDSRGTQVFTEFWRRIRGELGSEFTSVVGDPSFWAVSFDQAAPLTTPRGIDVAHARNRELVVDALSDAVLALDAAGVALDAPWREVQFDARRVQPPAGEEDPSAGEREGLAPHTEERLSIHGGDGNMGVYGAISAALREGGYSAIQSGTSYVQAATWDDSECPIADTILAHSQSSNPASAHYRDQTALYAAKQWVRFPFCEAQIAAEQIGETTVVEE